MAEIQGSDSCQQGKKKKKDILKVHVIQFFSATGSSQVSGRISNEAVCLILEGMNQMKT